jgi:hypothetical protein
MMPNLSQSRFPDRREGKHGFNLVGGTSAGVYGYGTRKTRRFSLEKIHHRITGRRVCHQACAVENIDGKIYILSYRTVKRQLKHLTNTRWTQNWFGTAISPSRNWLDIIEFSWYWCWVIWVLKIETVDQLARMGSECHFIGPAPAYGISAANAQKDVKRLEKVRQQKILRSP